MPNWCVNELTVSGEQEGVARFVANAQCDDEPLSFEKIVPIPDAIDKMPYDPYEYWARVILWGTKWDVSEVQVIESFDGLITYSFDTAWSPPLPFVVRTSRVYKNVCFDIRWDEPGVGLFGRVVVKDGKVMEMAELLPMPDDNELAEQYLKQRVIACAAIAGDQIELAGKKGNITDYLQLVDPDLALAV